MDDLRKATQELLDEREHLLRRLNDNDEKMRNLMAEMDKLKQSVQGNKTTVSTSGDQNTDTRSTVFRDPFLFIEDMHNSLLEDEQLTNDADDIIGNFFDYKLFPNDVLEKMSSLCPNRPDLLSGLKSFLETPDAVSRARKIFHQGILIMLKVAQEFGEDSWEYREFSRIFTSEKKNYAEMRYQDKQLEELLKEQCDLKNAAKKFLKDFRSSD